MAGGCYMAQYRQAGKIDITAAEYQELKPFTPGFDKVLYHAGLSVNSHEFSGLMMIKSFEGGSFKVAFFNELGMNFFDLELLPDNKNGRLELLVNHIYPPLDRKILLNNFEKYFNMLLAPGLESGDQRSFLREDGNMVMIRLNTYKGRDAYLSRNLIEPYASIVNLSKLRGNDRITIILSPGKENFAPESIHIKQPGMRMEMDLELVN